MLLRSPPVAISVFARVEAISMIAYLSALENSARSRPTSLPPPCGIGTLDARTGAFQGRAPRLFKE